MLTLTLKNTNYTLPLTIANGIVVDSVEGLTPVSASISTTKLVGQAGASITTTKPAERDISIDLTLTKPYEARHKLYHYAPSTECTLLITDKHKGIYLCATGTVESLEVSNWQQSTTATISLICSSSYLQSQNTKVIYGTSVEPSFSFPFSTDVDNTGNLKFGSKLLHTTLTLHNSGDVETGATFRIKASQDDVVNPSIYSDATGETMTYNGTINAGETLIISTTSGNRHYTLTNGETTQSALQGRAEGSAWLQVPTGESLYVLTCDEGGSFATLTVSFTEEYIGV